MGYGNGTFLNLGFVNLTNTISKGLKRTYTFLARWAILAYVGCTPSIFTPISRIVDGCFLSFWLSILRLKGETLNIY
jgi:hypothetical protein